MVTWTLRIVADVRADTQDEAEAILYAGSSALEERGGVIAEAEAEEVVE